MDHCRYWFDVVFLTYPWGWSSTPSRSKLYIVCLFVFWVITLHYHYPLVRVNPLFLGQGYTPNSTTLVSSFIGRLFVDGKRSAKWFVLVRYQFSIPNIPMGYAACPGTNQLQKFGLFLYASLRLEGRWRKASISDPSSAQCFKLTGPSFFRCKT